MDYKIDRRKSSTERYYPKSNVDLAFLFAKECHKECKDLVKAIVLFGGTARKKQGTQDIDVLVVLDDVALSLSQEVVQTYRIIIGKIIAQVSRRLHITTLRMSAFWEYTRVGDPVAVNMLRDGVALYDSGFFDPLQHLLLQGRIRPTPESIYAYMTRSEATLSNARWHVFQAVIDLYWAVIDSAHAALMRLGHVPPSPDHVAELLDDHAVKENLIPKHLPNQLRKFYTLMKEVTGGKRQDISGKELDLLVTEAQEFVDAMKAVVSKTN